MTTTAPICLASVFDTLSREGLDAALERFPELKPHSELLASVAEAESERAMHQRLERNFCVEVDELMTTAVPGIQAPPFRAAFLQSHCEHCMKK